MNNFINYAITYICKLSIADRQFVIKSNRKTGFVDLIVSLKSTLNLYNKFITVQSLLLYLPLYKISQDYLELFFSSVRSKGRWNYCLSVYGCL